MHNVITHSVTKEIKNEWADQVSSFLLLFRLGRETVFMWPLLSQFTIFR